MWRNQFADPETALKESLSKLKLDYVDLYLVHCPLGYNCEPKVPMHVLWPKLEALAEQGLTKDLGVSNFNG